MQAIQNWFESLWNHIDLLRIQQLCIIIAFMCAAEIKRMTMLARNTFLRMQRRVSPCDHFRLRPEKDSKNYVW